jgi:hypothetical protein
LQFFLHFYMSFSCPRSGYSHLLDHIRHLSLDLRSSWGIPDNLTSRRLT